MLIIYIIIISISILSNFGSTCQVPEKLLKQIEKSSIIDKILSWAKFKQNAELKRKGGSKRSKLLGQ